MIDNIYILHTFEAVCKRLFIVYPLNLLDVNRWCLHLLTFVFDCL